MKEYLFVLSIVGFVLIACDVKEHCKGKSDIDNGCGKYVSKSIGVKKTKSSNLVKNTVKVKVKKKASSDETIFNLRLEIIDLISKEVDKIKYSELKIMSEPHDFYGLPFSYTICREKEFVLVCSNPECTRMYRRRFYASLDYDEHKFEELRACFAKINLSGVVDLLNCIFSVVSCKYQLKLEYLIENMNLKRDILLTMSIRDLDYIKSNLEWILSLKKTWNAGVDEIIDFLNRPFKGTEFILEEFNYFMNQRFKSLVGQIEKLGMLVAAILELVS
ncbi:hypothetical protein A7978_05305 (plasmid) [Borrelia turicatae]|uniref:Lipoprotein n=1 Tax=Borrelia turicatae TaxID=142 RepID=A0A172XD51_BORTU|nr:complement regulator-acquiring protein [Borrelia turicatae]ANF34590.1 hypothetical protein A7978_05305 [Borrelia turicatae]UPA15774.1 complement regulator-acquiring protein [Borrelia turicatae]